MLIAAIIPLCEGQSKVVGGVSFPVGEFAGVDSVTGGYARTGFAIGIETRAPFYLGSEIGLVALLNYHPVNGDEFLRTHRNIFRDSHLDEGEWILFWPMVSLGYTLPVSPQLNFYAHGLGGILFGASPDMTVNTGGVQYTQNMALVISAAYGGTIGTTIGRVDCNVRYLVSRPEYDINIQGQGTSTERRSLYVTKTFQLLVGIVL
jgi:hypothetical protein